MDKLIKAPSCILNVNSTLKHDYTKLLRVLGKTLVVIEPFLHGKKIAGESIILKKQNFISLNLVMCGAKKIRSLNKLYRDKDKKTDVLSFPVHESLRTPQQLPSKEVELGDIYICHEVAMKQSIEFNISFEQEVIHQFIHGLLHLVGHDHEVSQKEAQIMFRLEDTLVEMIYNQIY
ncbi:MAG: rRNA maturation RNase YbeY [Halobacteriovoraceae bacterium]|nr:rRNA maturation RNase YbeY [Halobacteriovoraceae bacterium]